MLHFKDVLDKNRKFPPTSYEYYFLEQNVTNT